MGQDDVGYEARGSVSINNRMFNGRRRLALAATRRRAAARRIGRPWPLLLAGSASLAIPLLVRHTAIEEPTLRAALETMLTLFAFAAAWLLRAQCSESRRLCDLLLLSAALALGLINLCDQALPAALDVHGGAYLSALILWGQLVVAGLFAAAALARSDWVVARGNRRFARSVLLGLTSLTAALLGGIAWTALGLDPRNHAVVAAHVVAIAVVIAAVALLVYAAIQFARRNLRETDGVSGLLALSALLLAGAALPHVTLRVLPSGQIDAGEAQRIIAFALILLAAFTIERRVRARLARAAAVAERRRVARDLHDSLAQDLAFIAAHGAHMLGELGEKHPMVVAARRALAISRSTISDLADPEGASVGEALDAVAQELRERFDVAIAVNAQVDGHLPSGMREHLSRIAREAIANAARHGQARNVLVSVRRAEGGVELRVIDDGCGLLAGANGSVREGFGLRSIRERAGALGGSLTVRRVPQGGTEVEVVVP